MTREVEVAKNIILNYLSLSLNAPSLNARYEIQHDNKKELYEHIKALYDIFGKAMEDLEKEINND